LPACDHVGIEGHAHIIIGAEQDRALPLIIASVGESTFSMTMREGIAHAGGEQRLALGDQRVELRKGRSVDHLGGVSPVIGALSF
jgi:hypothetical protein